VPSSMVGERAGIFSSIGMKAGFPFRERGRQPLKQQSRGNGQA